MLRAKSYQYRRKTHKTYSEEAFQRTVVSQQLGNASFRYYGSNHFRHTGSGFCKSQCII